MSWKAVKYHCEHHTWMLKKAQPALKQEITTKYREITEKTQQKSPK